MKTTRYLKLEKRITDDDRGGVIERWRYGRLLLEARTGRKQLPHGLIDGLTKEAERAGINLSRREIQRRIQCAEAYDTEEKCARAGRTFGSWTELRDAGFPPLDEDGSDPDQLAESGLGDPPDKWEQTELDIPGLKPIISVRGRKVPLIKGEGGATVADVAAYLDMCQQMHDNFGKTVDQIKATLQTMREHGGEDTNAVEAWEAAHATEDDVDNEDDRDEDGDE